MDETLLIERCRQGEAQAQRMLYEANVESMFALCLRYLSAFHEAEDAMLRGFFQFFKSIEQFNYRGQGSIRAYLSRLMINECLMQLRKENRFVQLEEDDYEQPSNGNEILDGLSAKDIFTLIGKLPTGFRTVFNLFAVEGYTHTEIAQALNISEGTSKSQLSRAKAMLRGFIAKTEFQHEKR